MKNTGILFKSVEFFRLLMNLIISKSNLLSLMTLLFCFTALLPLSAQVIDIGNRRQLFVDNKFVIDKRNVDLRFHQPRKTEEITIPSDSAEVLGGYNSVLEKDGIYHMWYTVSSAVAYARSNDGIHWERPVLDLTAGADKTIPRNIVIGHGAGDVKGDTHGLMVFIDPVAPVNERFRLVTNPGEFSRFMQVFSSPDGINWKHTHRDMVIYDNSPGKFHHLDSPNVIFWDTRLKKYVTYIRYNTLSNEPGNKQVRHVARGESSRMEPFGDAADMPIVMHGSAREDIYTSGVILYPWADDVYLAFPSIYYHYGEWHREFAEKAPFNAGTLDVRFAISRDGLNWNNFNWETFVPLGMNGEFDSKSIYMCYGIVPALNGREMYMYYWGTNEIHAWGANDATNKILTAAGLNPHPATRAISRVVLRRDGFVSLHAPYEGGEFTTPPLHFSGNQLVLNIQNASTGEVQVEIQDENGKPIPGFALSDCDLIHTANEINRVVTWNGESALEKLEGKTISLRFVLRDTDLYAFQFRDRPAF